jgi:Domain of unknown function (DUF222)
LYVLERLNAAIDELDDEGDPGELRQAIDRLELKFCRWVQAGRLRGDHHLSRLTPTGWVARSCLMSRKSAEDRLLVGRQLESLPKVDQALEQGEIGYQSASAICHLKEQLGEMWQPEKEEELVGYASNFSVERFHFVCRHTRYAADPDGFDKSAQEDYERRWLKVSPMLDGMHAVDGVLDPVTGAAFRTALDSLSDRRGKDDNRNHGQRMADSLGELLNHVMDTGKLPRRHGVRPHITITTTLEGLKRELGSAASELQPGIPISGKTVQRLACDGTLSRVLKADSVVVDVGRATRAVSPAQWRALKARHTSCCWPGCDRPISWTNPHHIDFWCFGGSNNLPNLAPLCHYHHRLVHEGDWQVVKVGNEVRFISPPHLWGGGAARRWGESAA